MLLLDLSVKVENSSCFTLLKAGNGIKTKKYYKKVVAKLQQI